MSKSSNNGAEGFKLGSPAFMRLMAELESALVKRINATTGPARKSRTQKWEATFVSAPKKTVAKSPTSKPRG